MSDTKTEISVGIFMVIGLLSLGYLAIHMGDVDIFRGNTYALQAKFTSVSGLKTGSWVEAAGVRVGKVSKITFDTENYLAVVTMEINDGVKVQEDATASIRTSGIIGDKFVKISAGGSDINLEPGMEIYETEPSISLEELISKYIFESGE